MASPQAQSQHRWPSPPPHLLLFPFPALGHVHPFLDLGERLSSSGVLCTLLLTPAHFHAHRPPPSGPAQLLRFAVLDDLPPEAAGLLSGKSTTVDLIRVVDTQLIAPLRNFILLSHAVRHGTHDMPNDGKDRGPPISCIISDSFTPWTLDVAKELGIPRVEMWTASATAYMLASSLPLLISKGLLPFKQGTQDLSIGFLPGFSAARLGHVPLDFLNVSTSSHPILQTLARAFSRSSESERVLVNSLLELESGAVEASRAKNNVRLTLIGPGLGAVNNNNKSGARAMTEAQLECLLWLDKQEAKSVVYVAFGSEGFLTEEEIGELGLALEEVGQPFLWAIRDGSATDSLRGGRLPPEKGLIIPWAPQRRVLEHGSVGAFVSHCGWNSVLESLWNGVPIVACPRLAEQNTNMWLIQEWGIGVPAVDDMMGGIGSLRHSNITRVLRRVMGTPGVEDESSRVKLRKKVSEMAAAARSALSPSGTSAQAFQDFLSGFLLECKD